MPEISEPSQHNEQILDPDLPICDPHHHLWDHPGSRYLRSELLADLRSGHRITHTVFVECTSEYRRTGPAALAPVGETEFVCRETPLHETEENGTQLAAGIVGYADLTLGDAVTPVLEAHLQAGGKRFKGIRHASGWHQSPQIRNSHTNPPPELLASVDFRAGFARLAPLGLSFDAWLYHPQIPQLTNLALSFPNTLIILDHCGGPLGIGPYAGRRDQVFASWRKDIERLAECPNVVVKLGGLLMKISGFAFHKRPVPPTSAELEPIIAPYYRHCIDSFGIARCMFESNFPVDKVSCSYLVLWNLFKRLATSLSPAEKLMLFRDNALRCYRLPDATVAGTS